jgi:hypothetical protein
MSYSNIKEKLVDIESINDDKSFIRALIIKKCVVLLEETRLLIRKNRGSITAPLLRQVFEYTIILAGLDGFMSLNQFIEHVPNDKLVRRIRDKIESWAEKNNGRESKDIFRGYTKILFDLLSEYTHANIDNLIRFSLEEYSDSSTSDILDEDALIIYDMVKGLFIIATNQYLNLDDYYDMLDVNRSIEILKKAKQINIEGNPVYNRILSIDAIKLRYKNKFNTLKQDVQLNKK